jgi:hypothetical protein
MQSLHSVWDVGALSCLMMPRKISVLKCIQTFLDTQNFGPLQSVVGFSFKLSNVSLDFLLALSIVLCKLTCVARIVSSEKEDFRMRTHSNAACAGSSDAVFHISHHDAFCKSWLVSHTISFYQAT